MGKGYAIEGARACLKYGFETLNLEEIVAFTAGQNMRSRAIMEHIGMQYDSLIILSYQKEHKLSGHVLYRIGIKG